MGKSWSPRARAWISLAVPCVLAAACVTRPVSRQYPTTKEVFTSSQVQAAVDKVDLLFAIDNSPSMGDKQAILKRAVPGLLKGLIHPHCIDPDTGAQAPTDDDDITVGRADPGGTRASFYGCGKVNGKQYDAEFRPVTDLHIGVVSSSLGSLGGDQCDPSKGARLDDRAHLLGPGAGFLAWFPPSEENTTNASRHPAPGAAITTESSLTDGLGTILDGVGQTGCGFEAQLESVYRFLVQPDPWTAVTIDPLTKQASLGEGIDWELLAQRKAFLRPDSLVAVVMLTDEDDSIADPLSLDGQGWFYMSQNFPGGSSIKRQGPFQQSGGYTAPRATSACDTNPNSPDCTSCGLGRNCAATDSACLKIMQDPNCSTTDELGSNGSYAKDEDAPNIRFFRMKQRFGVDPQYPIQRYVNGFTSTRVPDRTTEHLIKGTGKERVVSAYNAAGAGCTNPLFAGRLPSQGENTCLLPSGPRSPSSVFFAIVGGVPNELLYGTNPDGSIAYQVGNPQANRTTAERWTKILGADPVHHDDTGIDPHMIASSRPRPGLDTAANPSTAALGSNGTDPITGREWQTAKTDLQYACTFPLPEEHPCSIPDDPSCDCASGQTTDPAATKNPPLCKPGSPTTQIRAKAYPTLRELEVARALGDQGIAASLCPITLSGPDTSETFGYNPAVASVVDRLRNALTVQCLPQKLREADAGTDAGVPCLILAQLAPGTTTSCADNGLETVDDEVLRVFLEEQAKLRGAEVASRTTCKVPQVMKPVGESCKDDAKHKVWCYVENSATSKPAKGCGQAIVFSEGTQTLSGAEFALQCIRQFAPGEAAGDTQ